MEGTDRPTDLLLRDEADPEGGDGVRDETSDPVILLGQDQLQKTLFHESLRLLITLFPQRTLQGRVLTEDDCTELFHLWRRAGPRKETSRSVGWGVAKRMKDSL